MAERGRRGARPARGAGGQAARRLRRPAARLRPLGRARVDARACSTRSSTSASTTSRSRGSPSRPRTTASRGTPTAASCRCSATSRAGCAGEAFEEAIKEAKEERGVEDDTDLDTDDLKALTEKFKERYQEHDRRGVPAGPAGAAAARDPRRVRLLDRRARGRLPAAQPHPRRLGHGGQRAADGVRQQGRRRRRTGVAFSAATR